MFRSKKHPQYYFCFGSFMEVACGTKHRGTIDLILCGGVLRFVALQSLTESFILVDICNKDQQNEHFSQ